MDSVQQSTAGGKPSGDRRPSMKKRASSVFNRARLSFYSSGGTRGASVETLRGSSGADFEGKAKVQRGGAVGMGGCCSCRGDGEPKMRYVLIKGAYCFVFSSEEASSPKFAISLAHMTTEVLPGSHRSTAMVILETNLGDVDYRFFFDTSQDAEIAERFARVVAEQAAFGEAEIAKKRLGHEKLMNKRKSVKYAESVAKKKVEDQPDAPVTPAELLDSVPVPVNAI